MQCLAQFEVSLKENQSNKTCKKSISSFLVEKNIRNRYGENNILIMIQNSEGHKYKLYIFYHCLKKEWVEEIRRIDSCSHTVLCLILLDVPVSRLSQVS